ncbi:MAG: DNA polymerase I [Vampirovibrionales bacterium]
MALLHLSNAPSSTPSKQLLLIDGFALLYRMYFALETTQLTTPEGTPVWAVYGFFNVMLQMLTQTQADGLAVALDLNKATFRAALYPEYKAHRAAMPEPMKPQIELLKAGLEALGVPTLSQEGYEADDMIGSVVSQVVEHHPSWRVGILTGDQDALQLVKDGRVTVLMPSRSPRDPLKHYDEHAVFEKLGVTPTQVPDYKALQGDTSDNIPGIPGVGPKTAAKLLQQFGSVQQVLANIPTIQPEKLQEKVKTYQAQCELSYTLATICQNVPNFEFSPEQCAFPYQQRTYHDAEAAILNYLQQVGFKQWLQKRTVWEPCLLPLSPSSETQSLPMPTTQAPEAVGDTGVFSLKQDIIEESHPPEATLTPVWEVPHEVIHTLDALQTWLNTHAHCNLCAFDVETTGLDPHTIQPVGMSLSVLKERHEKYFSWQPHQPWHHDALTPNTQEALWYGWNAFYEGELPKASEDSTTIYIPFQPAMGATLSWEEARPYLETFLKAPHRVLVAHNAKYEIQCLRAWGIELFKENAETLPPILDTMIMSYILHPEKKHGLKALVQSELGYTMTSYEALTASQSSLSGKSKGKHTTPLAHIPLAHVAPYGAGDAAATLELACRFLASLPNHQRFLLFAVDLPFVWVIATMEYLGIALNVAHLQTLEQELKQELAQIETTMMALAGLPFNPASPKQVAQVLFERLGLKSAKKTSQKTALSTDQKVLEGLAEAHPIVPLLLKHRQLSKLLSTYISVLPHLKHPKTQRVHTSFNQTLTVTGRLSSSDPNLQNIPVKTALGRKIREAFIPSTHSLLNPETSPSEDTSRWVLCSADYSQIELRLLAHYAQEEALQDAFRNGEDIHTRTAAMLYECPLEEVTKEQRNVGKTVNFGVIYGQSAFGLSEQLHIPRPQAQAFIQRYYEQFPGIRSFIEGVKLEAHQTGKTYTLLGRMRDLSAELTSSQRTVREFAERAAFNTPLQGTASDLMKLAMNRLLLKLVSHQQSTRMLLQVHDEVVLETTADQTQALEGILQEALTLSQPLRVPLVIDVEFSSCWH